MTRPLSALRALQSAARRRPARNLAAALVALLACAITLTPRQAAANPANIYVINENVATALNGGTPVDLTTVAGRAAFGVASNLANSETASAGQVPTLGTHSGTVVILVRTDGSPTNVTLNGRGLSCTPLCDGTTANAPAADGYVAYSVTGVGTHVIGDSFVATAIQDAVSLDSSAIKIVGPANNFQLATSKSTIGSGASSCGAADDTAAPTKARLVAIYTDVNANPLVGYTAAFAPAFSAGGHAGVAVASTASMLLPDGSTTAAADVLCGNTSGAQNVTTTAAAGEITGVPTDLTRTLSITVTDALTTISLTASPPAVPCNGTSSSTVTAQVTGTDVPDGTPVNFSVVSQGTANPVNTTTTGGIATSTITPLLGSESGVVVIVTSGDGQNSIRIDCGPSPDFRADALPITALPFASTINTAGFTTESGEPLGCGNMGATAWYQLSLPGSPPINQPLSVQTAGSNFNTALAIYVSPSPPSPPSLTNLGCAATGPNSSLSFTASSPGTYYIQVGGAGGATGQLALNVRCTGDRDCDGLSDADEALYGTDPNVADTDGDGVTDGLEAHTYHTNPLNPDTDGDGLTDGQEVNAYHTDPLNPDTDGDGLTDGQEINTYHTNPLSADTDNDGCGDGAELALTPPLDPANPWDFYSVPVPALFASPDPAHDVRGSVISASDAQAVFAYFRRGAVSGTTLYDQDLDGNGIADGLQYDRTVAGAGISGPPDGVISASEAQVAFAQFKRGYAC